MSKKICGVYKIQHVSGKIYIGSSTNVNYRLFRAHFYKLNKGNHENWHLQRAWNKYGEFEFSFELIEEVSLEFLIEREQFWMDFYSSFDRKYGYNIVPKANRSQRSQETIDKCKGWHHTEEAKHRIGQAAKINRKGKKHSDSTKKKIGDRVRGKNWIELYGEKQASEMTIQHSRSYLEKYGEERANKLIEERSGTYESIYGEERAKEIKVKQSNAQIQRHKDCPHNEEARKKMSDAALERWVKRKQNGYKESQETKNKKSQSQMGHSVSEETKEKIAAKARARWARWKQDKEENQWWRK